MDSLLDREIPDSPKDRIMITQFTPFISFLIHNRCNWPIMHYPDDLCHWKSVNDEEGFPETHRYQDDGFGNLIPLSEVHQFQILYFRHNTKVL